MNKQSILLDFLSKNLERGTIFFTEDCIECGLPPRDIRLNLSELVRDATVVRLARGIFLWPSFEEFSGKIRMPSPELIAWRVAEREHIRLVPCEDQCAYLVGLTSMQVSPYKYITDGGDRVINLQNGRKLVFQRRDEARLFSIKSEPMQRLTLGMRALGRENIGFPEKRRIQEILEEVSDEDFIDAIWKTPEWVRNILLSLRG